MRLLKAAGDRLTNDDKLSPRFLSVAVILLVMGGLTIWNTSGVLSSLVTSLEQTASLVRSFEGASNQTVLTADMATETKEPLVMSETTVLGQGTSLNELPSLPEAPIISDTTRMKPSSVSKDVSVQNRAQVRGAISVSVSQGTTPVKAKRIVKSNKLQKVTVGQPVIVNKTNWPPNSWH